MIPTFDGLGPLRRALGALAGEPGGGAAVCVVDNGSSDGTADAVRSEFPAVRVVGLERNLGFGTAVNRGVETSEAELVVLLNNDAVAGAGFVGALISAQRGSGAEMVAGCLLDSSGAIETLGAQADQSLIAYDYLNGMPWSSDAPATRPEQVLGPCGGAALFEREAFLSVGGFDEKIFAYLEDVELAIRMRLAGMRLELAPEATAVHEHSGTLGKGSARKNELLGWSRGYLLHRHGRRMASPARVRGAVLEAVTYAGKAAIDRNLGVVRGRASARSLKGERLATDLSPLPLVQLGLAEALRRRLGRRR